MLIPLILNPETHNRITADSEATMMAAALQVASQMQQLTDADNDKDTGKADRIAKELRQSDYPYLILTAQQYAENIAQRLYVSHSALIPPAKQAAPKKK